MEKAHVETIVRDQFCCIWHNQDFKLKAVARLRQKLSVRCSINADQSEPRQTGFETRKK